MLEPFLRLVASLAVIVGLLLVITRVSRKRFAGNQRNMIQVLARQPLSRTSAVTVLRVGSQYLVVGATEGSMTLLSELDPDEVALLDTGTDATDSDESVASPIAANTTTATAPVLAQTAVGGLSGSLLSKQTWKQAWAVARPTKNKRPNAPAPAQAEPARTDTPGELPDLPAATAPVAPVDELVTDKDSFTKTPKRSAGATHAPTLDFADLLEQASRTVQTTKNDDQEEAPFEEVSAPTIERPAAPIDARPKTATPKTTPMAAEPASKPQDHNVSADPPDVAAHRQEQETETSGTSAAPAQQPATPDPVKQTPVRTAPRARAAAKKVTPAKRAASAPKAATIKLPTEVTGTPAAKKVPTKKAPADRKAPARRPAAKKAPAQRRPNRTTNSSAQATAGKDTQ